MDGVTIYWDIDHCAVPQGKRGFEVATALKDYARNLGVLRNIYALGNVRKMGEELREDLLQCGVLFHEVVPEKTEMALMVEFLKFTCDNSPPHHLIVVCGDRDLSSGLNVLVFRGYEVTLIHPNGVSPILISSASRELEWNSFLGIEFGSPFFFSTDPFHFPSLRVNDESGRRFSVASLSDDIEEIHIADEESILRSEEVLQFIWSCVKDEGKGKLMISNIGQHLRERRKDLWDYIASTGGFTQFLHNHGHLFHIETNHNGFKEIYWTQGIDPPEYGKLKDYIMRALKALREDFLKPTESSLLKALTAVFKFNNEFMTDHQWKDILEILHHDPDIVVIGPPGISFYPKGDVFLGVDPNCPSKTDFTDATWNELKIFLGSIHPKQTKNGRYGFAIFLKHHGPESIKKMPLGLLMAMVQLATARSLLKFNGNFCCTVGSTGSAKQMKGVREKQSEDPRPTAGVV